MPLLMSEKNQLKLLNLKSLGSVTFHPPKGLLKVVYQGFILPDLPAPLYYLNFISLIGQPRAAIFHNSTAINTTGIDTATVLVSSGLQTTGHLKSYSVKQQCLFEAQRYQFQEVDRIDASVPMIHLQRKDTELHCDLTLKLLDQVQQSSILHWGISEYWSSRVYCEGTLKFNHRQYRIEGIGRYKYARAAYFPFLSISFYTYQIINLNAHIQVILVQLRNQWNHILLSKLHICQANQQNICFEHVELEILRYYPKIQTPDAKSMYLPREFVWYLERNGQRIFELYGKSRGDFKFGLAAGYVGSFVYQARWIDQTFHGEAGYCEYIDCRPLRWVEENQNQLLFNQLPQWA